MSGKALAASEPCTIEGPAASAVPLTRNGSVFSQRILARLSYVLNRTIKSTN